MKEAAEVESEDSARCQNQGGNAQKIEQASVDGFIDFASFLPGAVSGAEIRTKEEIIQWKS